MRQRDTDECRIGHSLCVSQLPQQLADNHNIPRKKCAFKTITKLHLHYICILILKKTTKYEREKKTTNEKKQKSKKTTTTNY